MKKYLFLAAGILFSLNIWAQQKEKYYRLQIFLQPNTMQQLAAAGLAVDHGDIVKDKWIISDFSQHELNMLQQKGFSYKILIDDVSQYYINRNKNVSFEEGRSANLNAAVCGTYTDPVNFVQGSMGGYYTYQELLAQLDSMRLKYPRLITKKTVVSNTIKTEKGRSLYVVKISDNPRINENEPEILYTALHHAREPLSATQLIYYMWYLLENYQSNPAIKALVDSTQMYFIPCINPDGYLYNQSTNPDGGGMWRKNRRNNGDGNFGVDLNRNYGYKWGYDDVGSSPYTYSDTYRGTSAFSEAETQMIRDYCNQHNFAFTLNNHTYGNVLVIPYSYGTKTYTPDSAQYRAYSEILTDCNNFTYGIAIQTVGYTANGDSDDWMYGEQTSKPKIFAFTPETGSAFDGFWPSKNRILPLSRGNMDMNIAAATFTKDAFYAAAAVKTQAEKSIAPAAITQCTPNPANNYTYISFSIPQNAQGKWQLKITDGSGMLMQSISINSTDKKVYINTSQLHAGLFYCTITNGSSISNVMKLFVVK